MAEKVPCIAKIVHGLVREIGQNEVLISPWLRTREAAIYMNMAEATLSRFRNENKGPVFCKKGNMAFYHVQDLDRWLKEKED